MSKHYFYQFIMIYQTLRKCESNRINKKNQGVNYR